LQKIALEMTNFDVRLFIDNTRRAYIRLSNDDVSFSLPANSLFWHVIYALSYGNMRKKLNAHLLQVSRWYPTFLAIRISTEGPEPNFCYVL